MSGPLPDVTEGQHRLGDIVGGGVSEPVLISHAVSWVAWLLTTAGWIAMPNQQTLNSIGTVVAGVLTVGCAVIARSRVSPIGRITWDAVRGTIRAMVYEEIDRLAAAAPTITAAQPADQDPAPDAEPVTEAMPVVPPSPTGTTAIPTVPQQRSF
jgi:hypothetical protein